MPNLSGLNKFRNTNTNYDPIGLGIHGVYLKIGYSKIFCTRSLSGLSQMVMALITMTGDADDNLVMENEDVFRQ